MSRPRQLTFGEVLDLDIGFDETGWWFDYNYIEGHDIRYYYGVSRAHPDRITFIERDGDCFSFYDEWILGQEISNVSISQFNDDVNRWYTVEVMTKSGMFHRYTPDYILKEFDREVYDKLAEDIILQYLSIKKDSREDLHNWLGNMPVYMPNHQWDSKYVEKFLKHNKKEAKKQMFLFNLGDVQYSATVQDKQVEIARTVITCAAHPEQNVTQHHYLTYSCSVQEISLDLVENMLIINLTNGHDDNYTFNEIACMFTEEGEEDPDIHYIDSDPVNHPNHYKTSSGLEAIDVIDAFTEDLKGYECTYTSQVLKYTLRWKHKNGLEDLEKANWYLTRLINKLKEANK